MLKRWQGGGAAAVVTSVTAVLVTLDVTDRAVRRWWAGHALTTSTVSGLLVLLITVLVIDQVVSARQVKERSRATAAQAAIVMRQATQAAEAVSAALDGSGEREPAIEEVRSYMIMLLIAAPVLIDATLSRAFLEQAQHLGGELARALAVMTEATDQSTALNTRVDEAVGRLREVARPLLRLLDPDQRAATGANEAA